MRRGRGVKRRGPLPPIVVPPDIVRKAESRRRKLAPVFEHLDIAGPEMRGLVAYYGWERVSEALQYRNPADVPKYLGDEDGYERFRGECARNEEAGGPRHGLGVASDRGAQGHGSTVAAVWAGFIAGANKAR